ncbi:SDR family NAD(P)-dependent oxidoreductase [Paraglaciecola arctica]|uniref:SDR family NAD(P)-dependent oxidoreductase n=1 Tax=Paraglaciecola arctica TaxID=1128911 RepID=UPI001C06A045|nr:SDR family oxidoreductase [Paraglaciecola arctica]MBU3004254.1 SDR family oxidoreductase [Paraglaciecola arctica]
MSHEKKLENKVAFVTGSSSGIGKAVALKFAQQGAKVAVIASSDIEKSQRVVAEITAAGGTAHAFVCDVASPISLSKTVQEVLGVYGTVDILVNAAGVYFPTKIHETSESQFDQMVNTNFKSVFFAIDAIAPILKAKESGKIINFSSVAAVVGSKDYGLYCAVKAGVSALTKTFALQLAPFNINVNAIAPGNTATPINEHIRHNPEFAERRAMIDASTPSRRKFSTPEDMANAVLFLASEDSRAMHGTTVLLDEGRAAGM